MGVWMIEELCLQYEWTEVDEPLVYQLSRQRHVLGSHVRQG